jgi:hypothetical protein
MGPGGICEYPPLGSDDAIEGSGVEDSEDDAETVLLASPVMMSDDGGECAPRATASTRVTSTGLRSSLTK